METARLRVLQTFKSSFIRFLMILEQRYQMHSNWLEPSSGFSPPMQIRKNVIAVMPLNIPLTNK